jgi:hypothetical protein
VHWAACGVVEQLVIEGIQMNRLMRFVNRVHCYWVGCDEGGPWYWKVVVRL